MNRSALVVVDMQNDFVRKDGALYVPKAESIVPVLNEYIDLFRQARLPMWFTRDWHPSDHRSFRGHGGEWPSHCVRETEGARWYSGLYTPGVGRVLSKGCEPEVLGYSAFDGTGFYKQLEQEDVDTIYVGGVATDFCVKDTVLSGLKCELDVYLLGDACCGLAGSAEAIKTMKNVGAKLTTLPILS